MSQQLKVLEQALGVALFERRGRAVLLTSEGAAYLREVQQSLAELDSASRRLRRRAEGKVFRLSTADFVAYEFLLPRLSAFRARFPGLELSLEATTRVVDFVTSDVDAAIRIADGPFPGLVSRAVGAACVTPVCSPALARQRSGAFTGWLREQYAALPALPEGRVLSGSVKRAPTRAGVVASKHPRRAGSAARSRR